MVTAELLRVTMSIAKVLIIRGTKDINILTSSKLVSFFSALYFYSSPGEQNYSEFHLVETSE